MSAKRHILDAIDAAADAVSTARTLRDLVIRGQRLTNTDLDRIYRQCVAVQTRTVQALAVLDAKEHA